MKQTLFAFALLWSGCAFKVGGANGPGGGSHDLSVETPTIDMAGNGGSGGTGGGGGSGGSGGSGGGGGSMDMTSPDLAPFCVAGTKMCDQSGSLETCRGDGSGFDTTACSFGCSDSGGAHCKVLVPTAPLTTADYGYSGLTAKTLNAVNSLVVGNNNYVFDTSDGSITGPNGTAVRGPNPGPDTGAASLQDGIEFRRVSNVAVWTFASLDIAANVTVGFMQTTGPMATSGSQYGVALVSQSTLAVEGRIDLRGYKSGFNGVDTTNTANLCADTTGGPGGGIGGTTLTGTGNAGGTGAGKPGAGGPAGNGGGGGASYGGSGGNGGSSANSAGTTYTTLSAATGGSGGGAGSGGPGGGGGGALELFAETSITISGTINAGGCGGSGSASHGGGGGGSGGALLLEAPTVSLGATAKVSSNGGGGGAGGPSSPAAGGNGQPGQDGATVAQGGGSSGNGGNGGNGGFRGSKNGTDGTAGSGGGGSGAGGGGAGRIQLNGYGANGVSLDPNAQLSPKVADGVTNTGMIATQ